MIPSENQKKLEARIAAAAESALAARKVVSAIDILQGIGWLQQSWLEAWRRGQVPYLERSISANLHKISTAMKIFRSWAQGRGLKPSETAYVARTRDRRRLRFTKSGDENIERAYRTHWISPELSIAKRDRLRERESRASDLVVIQPLNQEWKCTECGSSGSMLIMDGNGPLCLACADLDHLAFLPAGNTALSRRARQASGLSAVVVRFSRARKRYERQGILVEGEALQRAEAECLADEDARAARRIRDQERRAQQDSAYVEALGAEIRRVFPGCPGDRAAAIVAHASARGSGRIGRTAAGQALDEEAIRLAVVAAVRHQNTEYDPLLMSGVPRHEARQRVSGDVEETLGRWARAEHGSVIAPDRATLGSLNDDRIGGRQHVNKVGVPDPNS